MSSTTEYHCGIDIGTLLTRPHIADPSKRKVITTETSSYNQDRCKYCYVIFVNWGTPAKEE